MSLRLNRWSRAAAPNGALLKPETGSGPVCGPHQLGDHVIVTGEVLDVAERDGRPLIFHEGEYRDLG